MTYRYSLGDQSHNGNYTDKYQVIGSCYATSKSTCTISKGRSESKTVGTDLGATVA